VESLSPLSLILLVFSGLILPGWIFLRRLQSLLGEKRAKKQFTTDVKKHIDAIAHKYILLSRGSFYAYLQAIVLGLKGMKVEERAKEIIRYLSRLQGDFARFRDEFDLVGKHLSHAQSSYQSADKRIEQFGQKLLSAEIAPGEPAAIPAFERETG